MADNSFGRAFVMTTFGESHGELIGAIVDGCPAGVPLSESDIDDALEKRRVMGDFSTSRKEPDRAKIVSGIYNGCTTGAPVTVIIENKDTRPEDYAEISKIYRPGHADFTYDKKYSNTDPCGAGRASARETASRVAAGAVAKAFLAPYGIDALGHVVQIGEITAVGFDREEIMRNQYRTADSEMALRLDRYLSGIIEGGDSIGGVVELRVNGVPIGLGQPLFDKLDARLAYAMMGIPAVKGVEIGAGFAASSMKGSQNNDQMDTDGFLTNNAGGIMGGISNGEELILRVGFKPIPTIGIEQQTLNREGKMVKYKGTGRHDICAAIRGVAAVEAMAWLTLADMMLLRLRA